MIICVFLRFLSFNKNIGMIGLLMVLVLALIIQCVIIYKQPHFDHSSFYKIPFVPFVPFTSFIINMYLMMTISLTVWLILLIWMIIGFSIYFSYGTKNSIENCKYRSPSKCFSTGEDLLNEKSNSSI